MHQFNIADQSFLSCYFIALTKRALIIACWITVIATGAFLRFDRLSQRPFHADEATGARITSTRMESGEYRFDPVHYHGPILSKLSAKICNMNGETHWRELTKSSLRFLTAISGCLLILVPLLWRKRVGDVPMLLTAALFATSPLLVYYSRMFIHESLLVLFGMLALVSLIRAPRFGIPGLFIGLMFATKESFAISVIAWLGALLILALENQQQLNRTWWICSWQKYRAPLATSLFSAALVSIFFYTDGFCHLHGIIDAARTFFVYETVEGHQKPFGYYLELLAIPSHAGGAWWFGTPVIILALLGYASTFQRACQNRLIIRFIAYSTIGHLLIYSIIRYKTPWLICLPWAHVCLLAGLSIVVLPTRRPWALISIIGLIAATLATQFHQARQASGRYASDPRNPFAYVPTQNDIEDLTLWLIRLQKSAPNQTLEPIAVVGSTYWPLPWYLRSFDQIGYWPHPSPNLTNLPLVFAMPAVEDAVTRQLKDSHTPLPRGLRAGVPMTLFVKNDIWNTWMNLQP